MRDLVGGGHGPPPDAPSVGGSGLAPTSDDWMAISGGLEVAGRGSWVPCFRNQAGASMGSCAVAAPDALMEDGEHLGCLSHVPGDRGKAGGPPSNFGVEGQVGIQDMEAVGSSVVHASGEYMEFALSRGGKVLAGSGTSGAVACGFSDGVSNGFLAQTVIHDGQGLHGDLSAQVSMGGGNMQGAGDSLSAPHNICTPCVRQNASPAFEQQNPNVSGSTANPSPWRSNASAWSRPKVVPMPPKKDLGQISLDGTTALLDDGEIDTALKRLEGALVGRMFGRKIPYPQLSRELKRRWEGFGGFRLITLSSDCFICLFDCAAARDAILMEGPWVLFGQVLGLDRWSPSFSPSSSDGFLTPVWVRMPELPFFCWTATNIARIVVLIGEPMWIDSATDRLERGLFARACVRLDLSKPLQAGLWIEGRLGKFYQPLEYEGLSMFCFQCSQVGHKANSCKLSVSKKGNTSCSKVPLPDVVSARPTALDSSREDLQGHGVSDQVLGNAEAASDGDAVPQAGLPVEDRGAGPWMLVARKRRPNKGRDNGVLRHPTLQAAASGRLGLPQDAAGRGKLSNNTHNISRHVQDGKIFGNCQLQDAGWTERQKDFKALHVQVHANSVVQHVDGEQPAFGGFTAVPTSGVVKMGARRRDVRLDGNLQDDVVSGKLNKSIYKPLPSSSSHKDLDGKASGSCQQNGAIWIEKNQDKRTLLVQDNAGSMVLHADAKPSATLLSASQHEEARMVVGHSSPVNAFDENLPSHGVLVPYNSQTASGKMAWEGGKRKGVNSLKVERMLNDLGPVSLSPRKRRMIVVKPDGGDASSLLTS